MVDFGHEHDSLETLRRAHPAWRLLAADHAPLIIGFLHRVFIAPNLRSLPEQELLTRLEDHLFHLRERKGGEAYKRTAKEYLDEWSSSGRAWLRKYYPPEGDDPHFDLTPATDIQGLSDLSAPVDEVARLSLPVKRVFITENDINGLAFPLMEESLVLFGLGYGVDTLSAIPWLHGVEISYWGDIDTHGFAILDRLRSSFPGCRSILMDRATLVAHEEFWVEEPSPARSMLTRLNRKENELYEDLVWNRLRKNLRLEQERIGFNWVKRALEEGESWVR